uniref:restriction endonuclease subunit S n=2 Tax=Leuconostoc mesenteroides TaxID=1245 RepID=UPI0023600BFD
KYPDVKEKSFELKSLFANERGVRLTKANRIIGTRPLVTAGYENTGVAEYIGNLKQKTFPKNVITIDMFGNTFYRDYEFSADDNILVLTSLIGKLSKEMQLYFSSSINKAVTEKYSYGKQFRQGSFNETFIKIPIYSDGSVAFDYMETYIKELEAERIKELEAYLVATGLDDYVLSDEEEKLINNFKSDNVKWGEFNITDIFTVTNTHTILKNDIIPNSGDFPYITAGEGDNAVLTYISYDQNKLEKGNSIMIGGKTMVITYQPSKYFSNDSHNLSLVMKKNTNRDKLTQLFLVTALKTSLGSKYEWGNSISNKKIQSDIVMLPINSDRLPDYQLMNEYIKVLQKIIIKAVVEWKDQKIKATRKVVSKNNVD